MGGYELETITFRANKHLRDRMLEVVEDNEEIFLSEGHLIRCAIIKFLKGFDDNGTKKVKK